MIESFSQLNFFITIIPFLVLILGLLGFLLLKKIKNKKYAESLNFLLLEVKIPKESGEEEEKITDPREILKIISGKTQQLFSSLHGVFQNNSFAKIFNPEYLTCEIFANDKEINFYIGAPSHVLSFVEKQIHAFWPSAEIKVVADYEVFKENSKVACCEMVLGKSSYYPIQTLEDLNDDPLNALATAMSKLNENETAAIQILISPVSRSFNSQIQHHLHNLKQGKKNEIKIINLLSDIIFGIFAPHKDESKPSYKDSEFYNPKISQETIQALEKKASKPAFQTNIRIVTTSPNEKNAQNNLNNIIAAFSQFNKTELNFFKPKFYRKAKSILIPFIFRFPTKSKTILSSEELAAIFHFPNQLTNVPNIAWLMAKSAPPPSNMPEKGLILGKSIYRGTEKLVRIKEDDMRRHIYIIGKSGTGKSTLLENMILQDIYEGRGLCFIDPHGDAIESILKKIPKNKAEDVILFDPGDIERPMGLNIFEYKHEFQKEFLIQEMINILYKLYDPGKVGIMGPRFEHWFRNAALTLMSYPEGGTFIEVPKLFIDEEFRNERIKYVTDPLVLDFWKREWAQTADFHKSEVLGWFIGKFGAFMTDRIMRGVLGQPKSSFDLREIMDQGKILLVNLSKGKIGELNSYLLGMIFVAKIQAAAMSRVDTPEHLRRDFHLYVDEFQNFSTDSFATILSEARKYHLCLVTANQYIEQLDEKVRDAVFGNIGTLIAFRVGPSDAEFLEKEFLPIFNAHDLINIDKFHAYIKLLIDNKNSQPFSMATLKPNFPEDPEIAEAIKNLSRLKYGRDRQVVENQLFKRFTTQENQEDEKEIPESLKELLE